MKININAVHFRADKKLASFITDKVEKLTVLFDGIVSSKVILKVLNTDTPDNKIAEIRLEIRGNDLFAKKQCKTFEEATDTALEALRKQLVKYKEKLKD